MFYYMLSWVNLCSVIVCYYQDIEIADWELLELLDCYHCRHTLMFFSNISWRCMSEGDYLSYLMLPRIITMLDTSVLRGHLWGKEMLAL